LDKRDVSIFNLSKAEIDEGFWVSIEYLLQSLIQKVGGDQRQHMSLSIKSYMARKKSPTFMSKAFYELASSLFQVHEIVFECLPLPHPPTNKKYSSPHAFTLWGFSYYVTLDFLSIFSQLDTNLDSNFVTYGVDNKLLSRIISFSLKSHAIIFGTRAPANPSIIIMFSAASYAAISCCGLYGMFLLVSRVIN
jgi:hypothetical protein